MVHASDQPALHQGLPHPFLLIWLLIWMAHRPQEDSFLTNCFFMMDMDGPRWKGQEGSQGWLFRLVDVSPSWHVDPFTSLEAYHLRGLVKVSLDNRRNPIPHPWGLTESPALLASLKTSTQLRFFQGLATSWNHPGNPKGVRSSGRNWGQRADTSTIEVPHQSGNDTGFRLCATNQHVDQIYTYYIIPPHMDSRPSNSPCSSIPRS